VRTTRTSPQRNHSSPLIGSALPVRSLRLFGKKSRMGGSRSSTAAPETFAMVGWSTGRRLVAVDVAIAHAGPRDVAGWSMARRSHAYRAAHREWACASGKRCHFVGSRSRAAVRETLRMADGRLPTLWGDCVSGCGSIDGRRGRSDRVRWTHVARGKSPLTHYRVLGRS
jgi:hypothetical protein